ncbi:hypothetical protein D3C71_1276750 [compost metagenome]
MQGNGGNPRWREVQFELRRRLRQVAHFQQRAFEGNVSNPQAARPSVGIDQGAGLIHRQPPRAQLGPVFVDFRRSQLQVQGVELVFDQLQRKADLLIVELRLQLHLLVGHQAREQGLDATVAIDQQARHGVGQVQLGRVLHVLYEIQLVLGQERVCLHDRTRRWRFLQRDGQCIERLVQRG